MRGIIVLLFTVGALLAADPWAKVQELKSDTEVRIFKTHSIKPLMGKIEEVHADSIIVALKNEEISIPKGDIDRLDYRPLQGASRAAKTTRTTTSDSTTKPSIPVPTQSQVGPSTSSSTDYSFGSKPEFQTVYRRVPAK